MREKCPNTEFFGPYFPVSGPEKLRIWALFMPSNSSLTHVFGMKGRKKRDLI